MDKRKPFNFKHFSVSDKSSAMKVGTDAVLLGAWVEVSGKKRILDIGTGSGIISLMLAQRSSANITGLDIHKDSVEDAILNFKNSQWATRLKAIQSSFQEYSAHCSERYDLIVSNPPFFTNSLKSPKQLKNISKHNDLLPYQDLISGIRKVIATSGKFCIIVPESDAAFINNLSTENGFYCIRQLTISPKMSKPPSRVILEFSNSKPDAVKKEIISVRNDDNSYTSEYKLLTKDFYLDF
jgi:tRNA1Val (adenine37-N6)-methyltransferase